jgi:maltose O-acetyltransferase
VGRNSFIGRVEVQAHAEVYIGSHVCLNDGVRIITASHDVQDASWRDVSAPVRIEDFAWIATGATLLPGIVIGRGAVVGACAVVTRDVPAGGVAVGNPAQVRTKRRPEQLNYNPVHSLALFRAWLGKPEKTA